MSTEDELALTQRVQNLPTFYFNPDTGFHSVFEFARVPGIAGALYALKLGGGNWCVVRFETICVVAATTGVPGKRLPASYVLRSPQLAGTDAERVWRGVLLEVKSIQARWDGSSSRLIKRLSENEDGIRVRAVRTLYFISLVKTEIRANLVSRRNVY